MTAARSVHNGRGRPAFDDDTFLWLWPPADAPVAISACAGPGMRNTPLFPRETGRGIRTVAYQFFIDDDDGQRCPCRSASRYT